MQNRLIADANSGRSPAYWRIALYFVAAIGLPLALSVTIGLCALLAMALVQGPSALRASAQSEALNFAAAGVFEVMAIVVTALWVLYIDRRPLASIGLSTRRPAMEWVRGLGVGAGLMLLAVGLMAASGSIAPDSVRVDNGARLSGVLGTLLFFLIQGPAEEVVFRGYLLPTLSARGNTALGVGISSLLFSALHALNPHFGMLPIINLLAAGVMFALYALVEEGLWGVFGIHTAWNWVQGNVLGLPVSGGQFGPTLLHLREAGPDWLTGGAFGPEGSLPVTLLLVMISAWLIWRLLRRGQAQEGAEDTLA